MKVKLTKAINMTAMPPGQARYQPAGAVLDLPDHFAERMLDSGEAEMFYPEPVVPAQPESKAKK